MPIRDNHSGNPLLLGDSAKIFIPDDLNIFRRITLDDFAVKLSRHFFGSDDNRSRAVIDAAKRPDERPQDHQAKHEETSGCCRRRVARREPWKYIKEKRRDQQSCSGRLEDFLNEYLRFRVDEQFVNAVQMKTNLAGKKDDDQTDALAHELRACPACEMTGSKQHSEREKR